MLSEGLKKNYSVTYETSVLRAYVAQKKVARAEEKKLIKSDCPSFRIFCLNFWVDWVISPLFGDNNKFEHTVINIYTTTPLSNPEKEV